MSATLHLSGTVQRDWFMESSEILIPLIDEKNACRERLLQNDVPFVRREFRKCQCAVKAAVDRAREGWILKVSSEAETATKWGSVQWDCIKKLQIVYHVCKLVHYQVSAIVDKNGKTLTSHGDVCARWRRHFFKFFITDMLGVC